MWSVQSWAWRSNPAQLVACRLVCYRLALAMLLRWLSQMMMATGARVLTCWATEAIRHQILSSCGQWNIQGQRKWRTERRARRTGPASYRSQGLFLYLPNIPFVDRVPALP